MNKSNDNDWFRISAANPEGTRWTGTCWYVHNLRRYEFLLQFDIPVTYPATAPELELPQLDGKTHKMYRGGKICLTVHFKPLWAKNWYFISLKERIYLFSSFKDYLTLLRFERVSLEKLSSFSWASNVIFWINNLFIFSQP